MKSSPQTITIHKALIEEPLVLPYSGPQDMQRKNLSPRYSTHIQDIITVKS
jgi:hypothetical protein